MFVIYLYAIQRTLINLHAQLDKTILGLGGCWLGALTNETFEQWIPIQRFTPRDPEQQPGAIPALILIVGLILVIALGQI